MKKIIYILTASILMLTSAISASAEERFHYNSKEKIISENNAVLTMEMGITPEEAQVFWPVYNQIAAEKSELQKKVKETYAALQKALKDENSSEKDINKLLDEYLAAKEAVREAAKLDVVKYRKVLSGKNQLTVCNRNNVCRNIVCNISTFCFNNRKYRNGTAIFMLTSFFKKS